MTGGQASEQPPPGGGKGRGGGRGGGRGSGSSGGQGAKKAPTKAKAASFDIVRAFVTGYAYALASNRLSEIISVYMPQPTLGAVVNSVSAYLQNGGDPGDLHPTLLRAVKKYVLARNAYELARQAQAGAADSSTVVYEFSNLHLGDDSSESDDDGENVADEEKAEK